MSDLLNSASLVMVPSGYKEDTVYSVVPTNGNGDLSFTRASNGTRINSAGLVEVCPWNLLEYSEDFANAFWSKDAGATVDLNVATAPNGTTTADRLNFAGAGQAVYRVQSFNGSNTFSVYLKGEGANIGKQIYLEVGVTATVTLTGEWQRFEVNADNAASVAIKRNTSGQASAVLAWGVQVNAGTLKPYFPTTDRLNVPRLTYQNGGGGCPSLLLEKQSTNLVTYSEQFDNAAWTKNGGTITANTTISPDGTQNADTLTGASGNYRIYQIVGGLSSIDYTFSVFAKKGTANLIWFDFINVGDGPSFNFTTKAWSSASGWVTSYEEHANGWFRLIATKASNTTSAGLGIKVGAVNETVYLWGAQME